MAEIQGAGSQIYLGEIPKDAPNTSRVAGGLANFHKWIYEVNTSNFTLNAQALDSNRISRNVDRPKGAKGLVDQNGDMAMEMPLCGWSIWLRHLLGDDDPRMVVGPLTPAFVPAGAAATYTKNGTTPATAFTGLKPDAPTRVTVVGRGVTTAGTVTVNGVDATGAAETASISVGTGNTQTSSAAAEVFADITTVVLDATIDGGTVRVMVMQDTQDILTNQAGDNLSGASFTQPVDQDGNAAVELEDDSYSSQAIIPVVTVGGTGAIPADTVLTIRGNDANNDRLVLRYDVATTGDVTPQTGSANQYMRSFSSISSSTNLPTSRTVSIVGATNYDRVRTKMISRNGILPGMNIYEVIGGDPDNSDYTRTPATSPIRTLPAADSDARIKTTLGCFINTWNMNITGDSLTTSTVGLLGLRPYPNENPSQTDDVERGVEDASNFETMPSDAYADWNTGLFKTVANVKSLFTGVSFNLSYNNQFEIRRTLRQSRYGNAVRRSNPGFREITVTLTKAAEAGVNQDLVDFLNNELVTGLSAELFNANSGDFPSRLDIRSAAGQLQRAPEGGIEGSGEIDDPIEARLVSVPGQSTLEVFTDCKLSEYRSFEVDYS